MRIVLSHDVELNPGPSFKFGHLNARSLNGDDKFDEISELVKENGFDVFAVTETWLNDQVSSDCLEIPEIVVFLPSHKFVSVNLASSGKVFLSFDSLLHWWQAVIQLKFDLA